MLPLQLLAALGCLSHYYQAYPQWIARTLPHTHTHSCMAGTSLYWVDGPLVEHFMNGSRTLFVCLLAIVFNKIYKFL